jgi:4-hydroxythreonine-4-phosphate dehydrogenase
MSIGLADRAAREHFGISRPRIAVAALNPHAGEGGRLGSEEIEIIRPAVEEARRKGFSVEGPVPADTLMFQALRGSYDILVAMYHDQALIPVKMLGFGKAVNITVGLPFIRTSPDHGTAYDIAGRGLADPGSMIEAIRWAAALSKKAREPRRGA